MPIRNIAFAICALFFAGLVTPTAEAEPATALSAGELGVAQAVSWGLTTAEVKHLFPRVDATADTDQGPEPKDDPKLATIGSDHLIYRGCSLGFTFRFFKDHLDQFRVFSADAGNCHNEIERALMNRFRDHTPGSCPNVIHREWKDDASAVVYNYTCTPTRSALDIRFSARNDLAGRIADEKRFAGCQSIIIDVPPAQNSDRTTHPVLAPTLPDFGCTAENYYPPVSIRLQEQGTAQLTLRVSPDGSIAAASIAKSSGKSRLDDGALRLATVQLRFIPATRDGMPVEAERQVTISFRLLHFIHGSADFIIRCEGGHIVLPGPCHAPLLAIAEAPPKDGAKLTVRSTDFQTGSNLDDRFTMNGEDASPELSWTRGPRGTRSYVMIAEDPNAVGSITDTVVHWMVYDIPASAHELPEAVSTDAKIANPAGALNAYNFITERPGYAGYLAYSWVPAVHFQVFALDTTLRLDPATTTRANIVNAMKGHVLASGEIFATVKQQARSPECRARSC